MTQTDICNIALSLLGIQERISDIEEESTTAEALRLQWELARDEALRARDWNFASRRAVLSASATAPLFDFAYAYILPTDYIAAREFNTRLAGTSEANFEISDGQLLSNDEFAYLRYTHRSENVGRWSANFCQLVAHLLAAGAGGGLSTAPGLAERMRLRAEEIAIQATGPDLKETRPRAIRAETDSKWLQARVYGFPYPAASSELPTMPDFAQP